jgi:hypothetical protein
MISRLIPETIADEHVDDFFKFVIFCLDQHGRTGSIVLRGFDVTRFKLENLRQLISRDDFVWAYVGSRFCENFSQLIEDFCRHDCAERCEANHRNAEICQILDTIQVRLSVLEKSEASIFERVQEVTGLFSSSLSTIAQSIQDLHSMDLSHQQTSTSQLSGFVERIEQSIRDIRNDMTQIEGRVMGVSRETEGKIGRVAGEFESSSRERKSFEDRIEKAVNDLRESVPSQAALASLKEDISRINAKSFSFSPDCPLQGIIAYLSEKHQGNIMEKGIICVRASSEYGPSYMVKNIVDLTGNNRFCSQNQKDGWVEYDFKDMRIWPSHYTIRSMFDYGPGHCHLKSWVVEVSSNGRDWKVADRRDNNSQLNGKDLKVGFEMNQKLGPIQHIRLRLTGPNHANNQYLTVSGWEIFGSLREQ